MLIQQVRTKLNYHGFSILFSTATSRSLLNGSQQGDCFQHKLVRQGDPLSPCSSSLPLIHYNKKFSTLQPVGAILGPTHERARTRGVRRGSMQRPLRRVVRPVRGTGQTGRRGRMAKSDERSPGRDPIRASARRVVIGSASHLERLQTSRIRRKNSKYGGWKS